MTIPAGSILAGLIACVSLVPRVAAQEDRRRVDKTLSPFFFVENADPDVDRLPLKDTSVEVAISGVIADVTVRQVYENRGQRPLHARYVFPASTRAAVYGMTMTVGDTRIVARIKERETAKSEFDKAKRDGKSASLLEESRPNVFTMNVANVLPGDTISVELKYTELLVPTDGLYEFVYPTVVGPRYSTRREPAAARVHFCGRCVGIDEWLSVEHRQEADGRSRQRASAIRRVQHGRLCRRIGNVRASFGVSDASQSDEGAGVHRAEARRRWDAPP